MRIKPARMADSCAAVALAGLDALMIWLQQLRLTVEAWLQFPVVQFSTNGKVGSAVREYANESG